MAGKSEVSGPDDSSNFIANGCDRGIWTEITLVLPVSLPQRDFDGGTAAGGVFSGAAGGRRISVWLEGCGSATVTFAGNRSIPPIL